MAARRGQAEALIKLVGEDKISELVEDVQRTIGKTGEKTKSARKETDKWKESFDRVSSGINNALEIIGKTVQGARELGAAIKDAAAAAAVRDAFDSIAGGAAALERLRDAAGGTVDDLSLQKFGLQAKQAGIAAEQFDKIVEVAAKLAASGRGAGRGITSTAQALDELMDTIIGASDSNLEKFGIVFDLPDATQQFAREMGIGADQIDKAVESMAVLEFVTQNVAREVDGVELDSAIVEVQQLEAEWIELENSVKRTILEIGKAISEGRKGERALTGFGTDRFIGAEFRATIDEYKRQTEAAAIATAKARLEDEEWVRTHQRLAEVMRATLIREGELIDVVAENARRVATLREAEERLLANRRRVIDEQVELVRQTFEQNAALGQIAQSTGEAAIATDRYRVAMDSTGASAVDLTQRIDIMTGAAKAFGDEMSQSLLVLAEMAEAAGNLAEAEALRAQVAGRLTGDTGDRPGPTAKGGRRRQDTTPTAGTVIDRFRSDFFRQQTEQQEAVAARMAALGDEHAIGGGVAGENALLGEGLMDQMDAVGRASLSMADAFGKGFGGAASAVANASEIIVSQVDQITATIKMFEDAGLSSGDAFKASVPGMIAASGQLVAGFIGDEQAKAGVLALMETAASIASFAAQDYVGGALHAAAAIQYGLIAAGAFGSGSGASTGGGSGRSLPQRIPNVGPQQQQQDKGGPTIVVNMSGATIIGSDERKVGKDLARILAENTRSQTIGAAVGFIPG